MAAKLNKSELYDRAPSPECESDELSLREKAHRLGIETLCEEREAVALESERIDCNDEEDFASAMSVRPSLLRPESVYSPTLRYPCYNEHVYARAGKNCFVTALEGLGVTDAEPGWTSPSHLPPGLLARLAGSDKPYSVALLVLATDDKANHVELVHRDSKGYSYHYEPVLGSGNALPRIRAVTSLQEFFNHGGRWYEFSFYSDVPTEGFGDMFVQEVGGSSSTAPGSGQSGGSLPRDVARAPPVVDNAARGGVSNVSGGVTRRARRVVKAKVDSGVGVPVAKNYRVADGVMFNNLDELVQDTISRDYAQEIIESLFDKWGIPTDQPEATKYAEDLLFLFLISTTASNKADYEKEFEIPVKPVTRGGTLVSSVVVSFKVLSDMLSMEYGITRRQFSRGLADDQHAYLKQPENIHLHQTLATRVGCDPQLASYAFDGSTHCKGMTSREVTFTRLLESRNLFEDDSVLAQGSSDRLMQGTSGGPRSVQPR